jgi:hypothetical protein
MTTPPPVLGDLVFVQHFTQDASSLSRRDQTLKPASGGKPSLDDDRGSPVCPSPAHISYLILESITLADCFGPVVN